jgi:hypothetical protein
MVPCNLDCGVALQSSNGNGQITVCTLRYALLQPRASYLQFAMCQLHVSALHCIAAVMAYNLDCASYIARWCDVALVILLCGVLTVLQGTAVNCVTGYCSELCYRVLQ